MNFTKYNTSVETGIRYDAGLRAYMLRIFNLMGLALFVTGVTAFYASTDTFMKVLYKMDGSGGMTPIGWIALLSPLFMAVFLLPKIQRMKVSSAKITFWVFATLMGVSLGPIFHAYTNESIARTFFISASAFGAMSLYGYTTKKDLTSWGSFCKMGLIGILIAFVVNMFIQSSAISFAASAIGVLVFTGLTAYDTQKLKNLYIYSSRLNQDDATKLAINGALMLYLDFINLFIMLLSFFGNRRG